MSKRIVVCAANRYGPHVFLGARHFDARMREAMGEYSMEFLRLKFGEEQGFIDQHGAFMDRNEALIVATAAGQIGLHRMKNPGNWLCSEDLY